MLQQQILIEYLNQQTVLLINRLSRSTSDEEIEVFLHLLPLCKYEAVSKKQKINSHSTLVDFCNGILY